MIAETARLSPIVFGIALRGTRVSISLTSPLSKKLSDLNAYGLRIDHKEVDPLGNRNRRWLKQPDCPTVDQVG